MDELERIQKKIRSQENQLPTHWMLQDYLNHLKRTGAEARGTQANYLKSLRKILITKNQINLQEVKEISEEELQNLNREIGDDIQNSKYRQSKGEDGKRRKREYWTAWKKLLEVQGWQTEKHRKYMPKIKFSEKNDKEPVTRPNEIPNRNQVKQFLKKLGQRSSPNVALRNQALAILLWDKGPRIGEALNIQIKDVSVQGEKLEIRIPGNKKSSSRKVPIFQGRKTLKDWIEKHPYREQQDAYLFPILQQDTGGEKLGRGGLVTKFHQSSIGIEFKTSGEPFHIFRKGMVSSHIINEWATWEQVCKWHGKKPDSTKPDYLKMLMEDVNQSVAENMGVKQSLTETEEDNSMIGKPLLPIDCPSCNALNRCYIETCQKCGDTLPEHTMPNNLDKEEETEQIAKKAGEIAARAKINPDKTLNEITEQIIEEQTK